MHWTLEDMARIMRGETVPLYFEMMARTALWFWEI
jgi:hypothetical protein